MKCHSTNVCCDVLKSRNDSLKKDVQHAQFQIVEMTWLINSTLYKICFTNVPDVGREPS